MADPVHAVKAFLRQTPLFALYRNYRARISYWKWVIAGRPVPVPDLVKQETVKRYAKRFDLHIFVETGTCLGEMVSAVKDLFDEIYSIELGMELYQNAKRRFADAKHITILQGDSGEVLKEVLAEVKKPCLFWLDAHYSAGITVKGNTQTPIQQELSHILKHSMLDHVILIDDARDYIGQHDYPTIQALKDWTKLAGFDRFEVKDDIIRIHRSA